MRLIDADKEIEFYKSILYKPTPDVSKSDRWHAHAIINAFEMAKTVEVIRCKDCIYASHVAGNLWTCTFRRDGVNENGYCHSGCER